METPVALDLAGERQLRLPKVGGIALAGGRVGEGLMLMEIGRNSHVAML